jgi:flavodoxin
MKIAIVFYSFSGNTRRACVFLKEKLAAMGNVVDLIDLRPEEEETSFLKQCAQVVFKKKVELKDCKYDLGEYEFIMFASPVWAFDIVPALKGYLERVKNLENKKSACFLTYGSGAGSAKALKNLEASLRVKKTHILFSKNLSGSKTKDNSYLENNFKDLLEIIS